MKCNECNQVPSEERDQPSQVHPTNSLNDTLDQILGKIAADNMNTRIQTESPQASKSWILQALNRVKSSVGIDPLKYWASMMNTDARPIAVFAMEVLAIPATSAPIERIFSQAGLATTKHRNRTAFELLNSQLVVYCNLYVDDM